MSEKLEKATTRTIMTDINNIVKGNGNAYLQREYVVVLNTKRDDILIERLVSVEFLRNYAHNTGDYVILTAEFGLGDYLKLIYPFKEHLTCTIIYKFDNPNIKQYSMFYKVVILNDSGQSDSVAEIQQSNYGALNKQAMVKVEFQLYPMELEGLRDTYVDGVFKQTTMENLISGLFNHYKKDIKLNGKALEFNFNLVTPANDYLYPNILLPTGLTLLNLPTYLQNTSYGVYNGDIGVYFQYYRGKPCVWIYPLYSKERYNKAGKFRVLNVFRSPNHLLDNTEVTYFIDDQKLDLIAGSQTTILDPGLDNLFNVGASIVTPTNELMLNRNIEITEDGFTYDKAANLKGTGMMERKDGIKKVQFIPTTANLYKERSAFVRNTMALIQFPWQFSNPDMIYPGMPVSYMAEDSLHGITTQYGTVQQVYSIYHADKRQQASMVTIAVNNFLTDYKEA